jgi:tyrosine-protein phosphatase YwqE
MASQRFTDIHCHVVPGIDDGARDEAESLAMAAAACRDGTDTVIATPHQLGANAQVTATAIRAGVADLNRALAGHRPDRPARSRRANRAGTAVPAQTR